MNLDDRQHLETLDTQKMLGHIDGLPEQLQTAWQFGLTQPIPDAWRHIRQVIVLGMGGSAIAGDLLAGLLQVNGRLPVWVSRSYDLPAWAQGDDTLIIASSFSGNTEETLSAYQQAAARNLPILAMTTGGRLAQQAKSNPAHTLWQFDHKSQPRAALGWSLGLLLALAHRLGWLANLDKDMPATITAMQKQRELYSFANPATTNPAKRQAGQFVERMPVIFGAGVFEVVARRWKTQLNENSKIWAMYDPFPEANHNTVVGIEFPTFLMPKLVTVFLRSRQFDPPRVSLRYDLTAMLYLENGIGIDHFFAEGDSLLSQMMHAIYYGDYISFYAAIAQNADPTSIIPIDQLKQQMAEHS